MAFARPFLLFLALLAVPYAVSNTPALPDHTGLSPVVLQRVLLTSSTAPKFAEAINNLTAPVGREAVLKCVVDDLGAYKVAWLRVDTQTILTIHGHVITKNHRIGVAHTDHRIWYLHIKEVRESDRGWYMCQINTDPMKSQVGFLDVVVPPDILDYSTSTDMVVREGSNVSLKCAASGSPAPSFTWRREGAEPITLPNGREVPSVEGAVFNLTRVDRRHMGAYLCIASNGVPPSVSKRIMVIVHFPPMIAVPNQLVGAMEGDEITLECNSEAYPKSINYWTRGGGKNEIISHGAKYEPSVLDNAYKVTMKLTIHSVGPQDFDSYRCVSKNSLGDTDGSIKLYEVPRPSTTPPTTVTTEAPTTPTPPKTKPTTPAPHEVPKEIFPKELPPEIPHQVDMNEIALVPESRDHNVRPGSGIRSKIQENRYETTMDRSRYADGAVYLQPTLHLLASLLLLLAVAHQ